VANQRLTSVAFSASVSAVYRHFPSADSSTRLALRCKRHRIVNHYCRPAFVCFATFSVVSLLITYIC